jgi:hypothetical protein
LEVIFSRHAKRQMKWRDISEEEVKLALTDFDKIEDSSVVSLKYLDK